MDKQLNGLMSHDKIRQSLDQIRDFMETELAEKKAMINEQNQKIEILREEASRKDLLISKLEQSIKESWETVEGNRQLINKLLGDISKLQNDVEWYRRTYEKRSLPGVLWEKIFRIKK